MLRPDLTVSSARLIKTNAKHGETISLTYDIQNIGLYKSSTVYVRFSIAGGGSNNFKQFKQIKLPELDINSKITRTKAIKIPSNMAGKISYKVEVINGHLNFNSELTTGNNSKITQVYVDGYDIAVSSVQFKPETLPQGKTTNVSLSVLNKGKKSASSVYVDCYLSKTKGSRDRHLASNEIFNLGVGQTKGKKLTCQIPSDINHGKYYIEVVAYYDNPLEKYDTNPSDNVLYKSINITKGVPDIKITQAQIPGLSSPSLYPGSYENFRVSGKNIGSKATNIIKIALFMSTNTSYKNGVGLGSRSFNNLTVEPDETFTEDVSFEVPRKYWNSNAVGTYYIHAVIEAHNDKDNSNNSKYQKVYINRVGKPGLLLIDDLVPLKDVTPSNNTLKSTESLKSNISSNSYEMNAKKGITIFPNPTNGNFNVQLRNKSYNTIKVYNLSGNCVLTRTIKDYNQFSIELPDYITSGIYIVNLSNTQEQKSIKIKVVK